VRIKLFLEVLMDLIGQRLIVQIYMLVKERKASNGMVDSGLPQAMHQVLRLLNTVSMAQIGLILPVFLAL